MTCITRQAWQMLLRISSAAVLRSSVSLAVASRSIRHFQLSGECCRLAQTLAHGGFRRCDLGSDQDLNNCGRFYIIEAFNQCQRCGCRLHAVGVSSIDPELSEPVLQALAVCLTGA